MHYHKSKYTYGSRVYLVTDVQQLERIVTDVMFSPNEQVVYYCNCGPEKTEHYEIELSSSVNEALRLGYEEQK